MAKGTLSISDLLATQETVVQIGEDRVFEAIAADLAAHNAIVNEDLAMLVETTTDRQRRYGGSASMTMEDADEYGRADAEKVGVGQTCAFPLRRGAIALQWSNSWLKRHSVSEIAAQVNAAKTADLRWVSRALRNAVLLATNYTFIDRLTDDVSLEVKRLLNADGVSIPNDKFGNSFDGATHTHYLARAGGSFVAADLTALIDTVVEHDAEGPIFVYINKAQEAAVRGFTGFTGYIDARITAADSADRLTGALDFYNVENRRIGIFGAAEIWVKSWIPANYLLCVDGAPGRKPLVKRIPATGGTGDLELEAENDAYPLHAQHFAREVGFGVWNRSAAAVLYTDNTTWTDPTIS